MKRIILSTSRYTEDDFCQLMNIYGFELDKSRPIYQTSFLVVTPQVARCTIYIDPSACRVIKEFEAASDPCSISQTQVNSSFFYNSIEELISHLDLLADRHETNVLSSDNIFYLPAGETDVLAAISTRELSKHLVRVKSSNLWSYGINVRNKKDSVGDVIVQFKGKNGGPTGGLYIYYDVPINLWRKWITAPSKGHFFWQFIRNNFKYSKLDGNKKGVLPNAIN